MAQALRSLVRHIRTMAGLPRTRELSDRHLLERFVAGEESAFAALVQRHGALVLGVCRRVLQNGHDAEDAFQATFLVLAKKAASVGWKDSIGNWLHGVAYRIAMKARARDIRRRQREQKAAAETSQEKPADINWSDLRRVLDEELARLPARYRAPLLLCYLEGKTRDEAAQELGWSAGSVKGRLERGRELLRDRLARRGLALSAVLCASLLPESAASAAIPPALAATTVQAGVQFATGSAAVVSAQTLSLTQGVLHAMMWTKIKITTALILTIGALGIGGTVGSWQWQSAAAAGSNEPQAAHKPLPPVNADADEVDPAVFFQDEPRERAKEERGKETPQIRGQVKEIDAAKGTIALLLPAARGERLGTAKTLNLASKDIKIVPTFGPQAKLADLKEGMWVTAGLSGDMDVIGIRVDNPVVSGVLTPVEAKLRIILNPGRGKDLELKVDEDAKFNLNGKPAKFLDFKAGMRVVAYLSLDRSTVVALRGGEAGGRDKGGRDAGGRDKGGRDQGGRDQPRDDGRGRRVAAPDVTGVIVAINKNSIDVLVGTDDLKIESFELAKDFVIQPQGHEPSAGKLTDLAKAIRVGLKLSDDKKTVARIDVTYPVLRGSIVAVDAAKKTITLGVPRGADKILPLAKDARISIAGKAGTIADLNERMAVVVTMRLDRSQVLEVVVAGRPAERR